MSKDEALKLALEALETCCAGDYSTGHVIDPSFDEDAVNEAITAIKEALALTSTPCEVQDELCSSQKPLAKVEPCAVCGEGKARLSVLRSCDTCHSEYAGQAEMKVALAQDELCSSQGLVSEAMAQYIRVSSSGGMPRKLRESVQSLVDDAERLGYFKALVQPDYRAVKTYHEGKPVACKHQQQCLNGLQCLCTAPPKEQQSCDKRPWEKPWVSLTDEEIETCRERAFSTNNPYCPVDKKSMWKAYQYLEAKLKEKNT